MTDPPLHMATVRVPLRTVVASMVGLWACYFVLTTLRSAIGLELQGELLWRRALVCLLGVAVTFVLWLVLRLFDRRMLWAQVLAALLLAVPAALAIAQINLSVFEPIRQQVETKIAERRGFSLRRDEAGNVIIEAPHDGRPTGDESIAATSGAPTAADDPDSPLGASSEVRGRVVLPGAVADGSRWLPLLDLALGRYFLLIAWATLYFSLLAGARARAAERREARFRSAARTAELRSLRYQVNPHFLFNALNSLSALVMTGKPDQAEEMIQGLSGFYRHSLAEDPTGDVDLADEIDLQRQYLGIEQVRFPQRLHTRIVLPDALARARVPGMILQPLVENSVKYAVAQVTRPVTVEIEAREEAGRLVLAVRDDGPGVPDPASHGFGIGLANVRDRLEARFGPDAGIESGPVPGGYRTELRLPLENARA